MFAAAATVVAVTVLAMPNISIALGPSALVSTCSSILSLSCRSWRPVWMRRSCPQRLASAHQMSTSMLRASIPSSSMAVLLMWLIKSTHMVTKVVSNFLLQKSVCDTPTLQATIAWYSIAHPSVAQAQHAHSMPCYCTEILTQAAHETRTTELQSSGTCQFLWAENCGNHQGKISREGGLGEWGAGAVQFCAVLFLCSRLLLLYHAGPCFALLTDVLVERAIDCTHTGTSSASLVWDRQIGTVPSSPNPPTPTLLVNPHPPFPFLLSHGTLGCCLRSIGPTAFVPRYKVQTRRGSMEW